MTNQDFIFCSKNKTTQTAPPGPSRRKLLFLVDDWDLNQHSKNKTTSMHCLAAHGATVKKK
ncbi:hypothetical protein [Geomonas subterranea]|uniref:hypothetical protein n=1 Tax=Geomonas subterranea TaxID=2847989 RepID=UPI001CD5CB0D|nr:hypothetical protein [Geomonas fuzhouensis]